MESLSTVDNALDLLFALTRAPEPQGVSALARELDLPKTSTHRLLATLARRGVVEQDERRRYRPGAALVALGLLGLERDPLVAVARRELEAAAADLGETVFLAAPRSRELMVLDKVEGRGFLRAAPRVGEAVPVHATAVGKLALAFAPDEVSLGSGELSSFTDATPTSHAQLQDEVRTVALRGWAENRGAWIPGMSVVAVPVFRGERFVGGLALAGASARVEQLGALPVAERLKAGATRVAERLSPAPRPTGASA